MTAKKLFLVLVIFVAATAVSAQVNLGVKGGINLSNIYGSDVTGNSTKIGFHAGILADYEFLSIQQFKQEFSLRQKVIKETMRSLN